MEVARAHKVEVWSEPHWELLEKYAANFAAHGMKSIMTSITYDPWKSQSGYPFDTMVEWNYPGQFESGGANKFTWDFTVFDRYVSLMMQAGVRDKIDCYALVMGPGSTTDAHIRYLDTTTGNYRTASLTVGEPMWRQDLPASPLPGGLLVDSRGRTVVVLLDGAVMSFADPTGQ